MRGIVWVVPLIPQPKLSRSINEGLNLTAPTLRPRGVWRHQRTQSSAAGGIDCSKVAPCTKRSGCLYSIIPRETVRKVSEMSGAWPYGPPKRDFSAHCVVRIPAKLTTGALLRSLLGQFLEEFFSETSGTEGSNLAHTYSAA
jgi:hypothetical protein